MAMSDRVAVFRDGQIDQIGTPQAIYHRPATRFVAEFVGETNILSARRQDGGLLLGELGLAVAAPAHLPATTDLLLSVRPESVTLLPGEASAGLSARVAEIEFGGMTVRFSAEAEGSGRSIRVAVPSDQAPDLRTGAIVRLGFDLASATALPAG